jgi:hypothetical protein
MFYFERILSTIGLRDVRHAGIIAESKFSRMQKRNAYTKIIGFTSAPKSIIVSPICDAIAEFE